MMSLMSLVSCEWCGLIVNDMHHVAGALWWELMSGMSLMPCEWCGLIVHNVSMSTKISVVSMTAIFIVPCE